MPEDIPCNSRLLSLDNPTLQMKQVLVVLLVLLSFQITAAEARAQWFSSPNVPIDDPVYRDIDKLVSAGLIKDVIYGQRPWSRNEIARMIQEAEDNFDRQKEMIIPSDFEAGEQIGVAETLGMLRRDYSEALAQRGNAIGEHRAFLVHPLEKVSFDVTGMDSSFRFVPVDNGLGTIDARVNPLISYREGRHFADGMTLGIESVHWTQVSPYFSIYAQPRFEYLLPHSGPSDVGILVQRLYGKVVVRNVEIFAGRDDLVFGPGEHGGVLASNNARGLDMIKISNDVPFYHPWIFKYLGPSKYTFFVVNLGPEYVFKNAFLYGITASIKPVSFLELGIEHQVTVGGDGAPAMGLGGVISEFFFLRQSGAHVNSGPNLADHRVGAYFQLFLPPLRNSQIYAEGIFEDLGHDSFLPQFTQQMGFLAGFYIPLLTSDGRNSLRIEYEHVPAAYGRHGLWASGLSQNQISRGSELGPDGWASHVKWVCDINTYMRLMSGFHFEERDSGTYTETLSPAGGPDRTVKLTDTPNEYRVRLEASLSWKVNPFLQLQSSLGYEFVKHYNFSNSDNRNNFLVALSVEWKPGL